MANESLNTKPSRQPNRRQAEVPRRRRSSTSTSPRSPASSRSSMRCSTWPSARATCARAADIYDRMLRDKECGVILCLAGSLISAGLKKVFVDMIRNNMVDAIVSTGANMVDQDFFEALGFKHYIAADELKSGMYDGELREHAIDRIYDTLIDEEELRICDETTQKIFDELEPRPYSSRELLARVRRVPREERRAEGRRQAIIYEAYKQRRADLLPRVQRLLGRLRPRRHHMQQPQATARTMSWDGGKDFYELTQLKIKNKDTGLFMIGGGVPKNFTQDIVVAAEVLGARCADAQVRRPGHRRRRPRRRALAARR